MTATAVSPDSDLLTREQAAAYLGVKPQTLAVWATTKRYRLPLVKIGRNVVRYKLSDLREFVDSHAEPAAS